MQCKYSVHGKCRRYPPSNDGYPDADCYCGECAFVEDGENIITICLELKSALEKEE